MRPAQSVIDLKALCHNYQLAKQLSGTKALAVIKADAYGHGAVECAKALQPYADGFAVACIEEALELRQTGINNPILLLEGFFEASELPLIQQHNLWITIHSDWQIKALAKAPQAQKLTVFLKMDSGMHRVGFFPEHYLAAYKTLMQTGQVEKIILMTHFSRADELESSYTLVQYKTFCDNTSSIPAETCLSNSPTILGWSSTIKSDWIRPGIMLYGATPFDTQKELTASLQPVMTLKSKIISVRELAANESIGYGARFTTPKPMRIGIVAMGYADGYPRHAHNGTPVLIDGEKSQLLGRVAMDMLTVDLSNHPQANIGSPVELWGKNIRASDIAKCSDTIPYQLFCNIKRVPRLFSY